MEPSQTLIAKVIERLAPDWVPPEDTGRVWIPCLCWAHADTRPSAAVSYKLNAFACLGCGTKGSAISLLMKREEVSHHRALELAQELSPGSIEAVSPGPARLRRGGVSGNPRANQSNHLRRSEQVSPRLRSGAAARA
ncbi:DNA primase [Mycobacterium phage Jorgensen]|nr:DNA primase [Mycobacterium phage Jorgensen]